MTIEWLAELRASYAAVAADDVLYRIGRDRGTRVAEWPGLASLRWTPGEDAVFAAVDGADPRLVAKVEAGLARALVRSLDGGITLHASAVASSGCAIACVGASGDGKSSLGMALCRLPGAALLADDMAPLDLDGEVRVLPSERAAWLVADDRMDKSPMDLPYATEPAALVALVTLAFDEERDEVRLQRLTPAALLGRLVPSLVRFALDDREAHARELSSLVTLCQQVPGFELRRPRDFSRLDATANHLAPLFRGDAARYLRP